MPRLVGRCVATTVAIVAAVLATCAAGTYSSSSTSECNVEELNEWFWALGEFRKQAFGSPSNSHKLIAVGHSSFGGLGVVVVAHPEDYSPRRRPATPILSMPTTAVFSTISVLSPKRPYGAILAQVQPRLPQESLLGLALMFEMALGDKSPFSPWTKCLPLAEQLPMPLMWTSPPELCAIPALTLKGEAECQEKAQSFSESSGYVDVAVVAADRRNTFIFRSLRQPATLKVPFTSLVDVEKEMRGSIVHRRKHIEDLYNKAQHVTVEAHLVRACAAVGGSSLSRPEFEGQVPLFTALSVCASALGGEEAAFGIEAFQYALALLSSRAWYLNGVMVLVPVADMFNYAPIPPRANLTTSGIHQRPFNVIADKPSFVHRSSDFTDHHRLTKVRGEGAALGASMVTATKYHPRAGNLAYNFTFPSSRAGSELWEVLADRPYPEVGSELFELYGDSPNGIYFSFHGFVPGDIDDGAPPLLQLSPNQNPHETVGVPLSTEAALTVSSLLPRPVVDNRAVGTTLSLLGLSALPFSDGAKQLYQLYAASVVRLPPSPGMPPGPAIDPLLVLWALAPAMAVMPPSGYDFITSEATTKHLVASDDTRRSCLSCIESKGLRLKKSRHQLSHRLLSELLAEVDRDCIEGLVSGAPHSSGRELWVAKLKEMRLRSIQQLLKQTHLGTFGTSAMRSAEVDYPIPFASSGDPRGSRSTLLGRFRELSRRILLEHYVLASRGLTTLKDAVTRSKYNLVLSLRDEL